jgi:hypothetical protein
MQAIQTSSTEQFSKWFQPIQALDGLSMMDHLFNRLDGAYPHKWRSAFPNQQAIDNWCVSWSEEFDDSGVTPADIKAGLKACRTKYDWPPSCAEFIKACRPSVDVLVAYYEAVAGVQARAAGKMGVWSHPAIYWAAMPLSFDLGTQTYSQMKVRWERALTEQMERGEWAAIPEPALALPEPGKTMLSREKAQQLVSEYKADAAVKDVASNIDHLYWTKKIKARQKRSDKSLTLIQIKFADEALAAAGARAQGA